MLTYYVNLLTHMHQKYSDYISTTQVSNTIHNLWLYKLENSLIHTIFSPTIYNLNK